MAKPSDSYNLKVVFAEIARQWHPTKNGELTPDRVTPFSNKKVWWLCEKGHEWMAIIGSRNKSSGCPYCSGRRAGKEHNLLILHPGTAKQWHPTKNGDLTPDKVAPRSGKKVWWLCEKGHEWEAIIANRTIGSGCPFCAKIYVADDYNLKVLNPRLAKQWHPTKNGNLTPEEVTPGINKKVWWMCEKGHEWEGRISVRNKGAGCPQCARIFATDEYNLGVTHPFVAKQWHPTKNGDITPGKVTRCSNIKVWWMCDKGHEWEANIANRSRGRGCPYCAGRKPIKEQPETKST